MTRQDRTGQDRAWHFTPIKKVPTPYHTVVPLREDTERIDFKYLFLLNSTATFDFFPK